MQPFVAYVTGTLPGGEAFRRALPRRLRAQYVDIDAPLGETADRGQKVAYEFTLTNLGAPDTFTVTASDDQELLSSPPRQTLALDADEEVAVKVELTVPSPAEYGTTDTLTLHVQSASDPDMTTSGVVRTQLTKDADADDDLLPSDQDNCPFVANADQLDTDGDRQGDVCDSDDDSDAIADVVDNCGSDADGMGDRCEERSGGGCNCDAAGTGIRWTGAPGRYSFSSYCSLVAGRRAERAEVALRLRLLLGLPSLLGCSMASRDLDCVNAKALRARVICTHIEQAMRWSWLGHATVAPGYRFPIGAYRAVFCALDLSTADVPALEQLSSPTRDWRLQSAAEGLLKLVRGDESNEDSIFSPSNPAYLLEDGCAPEL